MVMGLVSKARDIRTGAGETSFPILYKMCDSDKNRDIIGTNTPHPRSALVYKSHPIASIYFILNTNATNNDAPLPLYRVASCACPTP